MIINKTAKDLTSSLSLAGANPKGNAQVYTYSSANLKAIVRQADLPVSASGFSATYPANSITLLVLPTHGGGGRTTGVLRGVGSNRCLNVPLRGPRPTARNSTSGTAMGEGTSSGPTCPTVSCRSTADKFLGVPNHATKAGTRVQIWDCSGRRNQQWNLNADGTVVGREVEALSRRGREGHGQRLRGRDLALQRRQQPEVDPAITLSFDHTCQSQSGYRQSGTRSVIFVQWPIRGLASRCVDGLKLNV